MVAQSRAFVCAWFLLPILVGQAAAQRVFIRPGPKQRPLFVQLYRQSVYAAARYGRGLDVIDGELIPGATAEFTIDVRADGTQLRLTLSKGTATLANGVVPFPGYKWAIYEEIERARRFGETMAGHIPGPGPEVARAGTDFVRARLAYREFKFRSLVWLLDTLGDVQRGKAADPEALKLMSAAYGWLARWLNVVPTEKVKLFQARSLAYAALAWKISGNASSELALALVHCGRPGDALYLLSSSKPDNPELSAVASALAHRDDVTASAGAEDSRQWAWTLALAAINKGLTRQARSALRRLRESDRADVAALHWLAWSPDAGEGDEITAAYAALPLALQRGGEFLDGRRPSLDAPRAPQGDIDWRAFVDAIRQGGRGEPTGELPRGARADLLLDAALDALLLRQRFLVQSLGVVAEEEVERAKPIIAAHPWGFAVTAIVQQDFSSEDLQARLAAAPMSYGALQLVSGALAGTFGFDADDWAATRPQDLDDTAWEDPFRAGAAGKGGIQVVFHRMAELDPYDSRPFESGDEALVDQGISRFGERPSLLRRKLQWALARRPRDLNRIRTAAGQLLTVDPLSLEGYAAKAAVLMAQDRPLDAAACWRDLVRLEPSLVLSAHAMAEMATAYAAAGNIRRARQLAIAASPVQSVRALKALAHAYELTGRYDKAGAVYVEMEHRFPQEARRSVRAKFLMRTGDPRGRIIVHSVIDQFFRHQDRPGAVLTDELHLDLLDTFLVSEEWDHAFELLNTVVIPRWHEGSATHVLWLAVSMLKGARGLSYVDVQKTLQEQRSKIPEYDPLVRVVDAFLQSRTPAEAEADLDLDPAARATGLYMLAQYYTHASPQPADATRLLESVLALRQYEAPEHYLALKTLGRVPTFRARLRRQLDAWSEDVGMALGRVERWRALWRTEKPDGTGRGSGK